MSALYYLEDYLDSVEDLIEKDEDDELTPEDITPLVTNIPLKRGDIIGLSRHCDRNAGKFIWDGQKAQALSSCKDEYGHVPCSYLCPDEFPLFHWKETIEHNYLVPVKIDKQRRREILKNLSTISLEDSSRYAVSQFTCNGEEYRVVFVSEDLSKRIIRSLLGRNSRAYYFSCVPCELECIPEDGKTLYMEW